MKSNAILYGVCFALPFVSAQTPTTTSWPSPTPGNYTVSNFAFDSGEALDELNLHYQTLGELKIHDDGSTNAVLLLHGSGSESGQFLVDEFAGALFNPGQALDAGEYFLILRDGIGHGESSTPRNTGLRADFPSYQYSDMVRADHQLLTEHFGINHTRLIMGLSMGGMHSWMFGEEYPDFMDALMPISSLPTQIAGHNRLWRKLFADSIQRDPAWMNGTYETQPMTGLIGAMSVLLVMFEGPSYMKRELPTRDATDAYADAVLEQLFAHIDENDANNMLYAYNASYTYDPAPQLGSIKARLTAVNTADDLMNPSELGTLEHLVQTQMKEGVGRAVIVPASNETFGHGSYIKADLWKDELWALLAETASAAGGYEK